VFQDRTIKTSLLTDAPAGFFDGAARACGHIRGFQRLDADRSEPANDGRCGHVVPVFADARGFRFTCGGAAAGLDVALRSATAGSGFTLRRTVAPIKNAKTLNRNRRKLAVRKRNGVRYAAVNANCREIVGGNIMFNFALKDGVTTPKLDVFAAF
jgi:hypothetical protein